ncbi:hypothetical protein PIB30_056205 [Stylosanthes scabra]|uniref:FAR1 domain-containing protein n=1 Tax=Stylosanthes scabra TaxID=79078 RepID=A0ABU6ZHZ8_9FABA|nr:hypothetical protein [Stylosanthes scabra]
MRKCRVEGNVEGGPSFDHDGIRKWVFQRSGRVKASLIQISYGLIKQTITRGRRHDRGTSVVSQESGNRRKGLLEREGRGESCKHQHIHCELRWRKMDCEDGGSSDSEAGWDEGWNDRVAELVEGRDEEFLVNVGEGLDGRVEETPEIGDGQGNPAGCNRTYGVAPTHAGATSNGEGTQENLGFEGAGFESLEEAWQCYVVFARNTGFAVRKGDTVKDEHGNIVRKFFYCNCQGLREKKHYERIDRKRAHKAETRTDC